MKVIGELRFLTACVRPAVATPDGPAGLETRLRLVTGFSPHLHP
jgi:hypothetical protein